MMNELKYIIGPTVIGDFNLSMFPLIILDGLGEYLRDHLLDRDPLQAGNLPDDGILIPVQDKCRPFIILGQTCIHRPPPYLSGQATGPAKTLPLFHSICLLLLLRSFSTR